MQGWQVYFSGHTRIGSQNDSQNEFVSSEEPKVAVKANIPQEMDDQNELAIGDKP
jgi:hypothetical protein